jgi:MFS family permease
VAGTIGQLIAVSALLGIGAGIIIPFSTSLVSMFFSGKERTRQYGYVSAITNITLVIATAIAGWLADVQWRLPFLVYLLPILSILLVPAIKRGEKAVGQQGGQGEAVVQGGGSIKYGTLTKCMLYYLLITYLVMAVSIDLPFLLGKLGHDSAVAGLVTAVFFLSMMTPGLFINRILALLKGNILWVSLLFIALGLLDISLNSSLLFIVIGCIVAGFGYGMAQPYIYDRASLLASPGRVTYVMALVMVMNYVAIVVSPFVVEAVQWLFDMTGDRSPFLLNAIAAAVALAALLLRRSVISKH